MVTVVTCPRCGRKVEWSDANPYRPFCSERCRLIDLGAWANEEYRIPAADGGAEDELIPPDPESGDAGRS